MSRRVAVLLYQLARKAAGDVTFLGCGFVALVGVWHFSPAVALIVGGVAGMAGLVVFGGGKKND